MTKEEIGELECGDILIDRNGDRWVITDFSHLGTHKMPTVVRTMVITFPNPWKKFEPKSPAPPAKHERRHSIEDVSRVLRSEPSPTLPVPERTAGAYGFASDGSLESHESSKRG